MKLTRYKQPDAVKQINRTKQLLLLMDIEF